MAISYGSNTDQAERFKKLAAAWKEKLSGASSGSGSGSSSPASSGTATAASPSAQPFGSLSLRPGGGGYESQGQSGGSGGAVTVAPSGRSIARKQLAYRMEAASGEHEAEQRSLLNDPTLNARDRYLSLKQQRDRSGALAKWMDSKGLNRNNFDYARRRAMMEDQTARARAYQSYVDRLAKDKNLNAVQKRVQAGRYKMSLDLGYTEKFRQGGSFETQWNEQAKNRIFDATQNF